MFEGIAAGGAGNDTIVATGIADKIDGGAGDDTLTGGAGGDLFSFKSGFGHDQITDFSSSQTDVIEFSTTLFSSYSDMLAHTTAVGNDVVITYDSANALTLKNVALNTLHASDFHFV